MKKQCSHCQKTFESRRNDAKFCSNGCRTNAHRAKNGIEKPAFLSNQKENKPPQKAVLSGVESAQTPKLEYRQVITPEWLEMERSNKRFYGIRTQRRYCAKSRRRTGAHGKKPIWEKSNH